MKYFLSDIFYTEIKKETASLQSNKDKKGTDLQKPGKQCITQQHTRPTHHKIY